MNDTLAAAPLSALDELRAEYAEYAEAMTEYDSLPPLPDGYDVRETFVRFRIAPLRLQIAAGEAEQKAAEALTALTSLTVPDDAPLYKAERYQAPKLKGLEDIKALCERNRLKAVREGVEARG